MSSAFDDELVIHRVAADRRSDAAILEAWLRDEARRGDRRGDRRPRRRRSASRPTGGHVARPAHALGQRVPAGPPVVLVAARPGPAGGARDGRGPRARPPAGVRPRPAVLGARRVPPSPTTGRGVAGCTTTPPSCIGRSRRLVRQPPGAIADQRDGRSGPAQRVDVQLVVGAVRRSPPRGRTRGRRRRPPAGRRACCGPGRAAARASARGSVRAGPARGSATSPSPGPGSP